MKKNWVNPEITALEIKETAGGPVLNKNQDGIIWWNDEKGEYEMPLGEDEIGS